MPTNLKEIRKAVLAGALTASAAVLSLVSAGVFDPLALLAAAAGGFVAGAYPTYKVPNDPPVE